MPPLKVEAGDRALEVLAEIMEMAPIRHMLGLNHTYESGCRCLRCKADSVIERSTLIESSSPKVVAEMKRVRLFYVQDSRTFTGNSVMWWRPDGNGYTSDLGDAWKVDESKAHQICRCRPTDKMWPCDEIDARAQRYFDMQRFRELRQEGSHTGNE